MPTLLHVFWAFAALAGVVADTSLQACNSAAVNDPPPARELGAFPFCGVSSFAPSPLHIAVSPSLAQPTCSRRTRTLAKTLLHTPATRVNRISHSQTDEDTSPTDTVPSFITAFSFSSMLKSQWVADVPHPRHVYSIVTQQAPSSWRRERYSRNTQLDVPPLAFDDAVVHHQRKADAPHYYDSDAECADEEGVLEIGAAACRVC